MISFGVIVGRELGQYPHKGAPTTKDKFGQAFLPHGTNPPLRKRVQIRRARREHERLYATLVDRGSERAAEFRIAVVKQVTAAVEGAPGFLRRCPSGFAASILRRDAV